MLRPFAVKAVSALLASNGLMFEKTPDRSKMMLEMVRSQVSWLPHVLCLRDHCFVAMRACLTTVALWLHMPLTGQMGWLPWRFARCAVAPVMVGLLFSA